MTSEDPVCLGGQWLDRPLPTCDLSTLPFLCIGCTVHTCCSAFVLAWCTALTLLPRIAEDKTPYRVQGLVYLYRTLRRKKYAKDSGTEYICTPGVSLRLKSEQVQGKGQAAPELDAAVARAVQTNMPEAEERRGAKRRRTGSGRGA